MSADSEQENLARDLEGVIDAFLGVVKMHVVNEMMKLTSLSQLTHSFLVDAALDYLNKAKKEMLQ